MFLIFAFFVTTHKNLTNIYGLVLKLTPCSFRGRTILLPPYKMLQIYIVFSSIWSRHLKQNPLNKLKSTKSYPKQFYLNSFMIYIMIFTNLYGRSALLNGKLGNKTTKIRKDPFHERKNKNDTMNNIPRQQKIRVYAFTIQQDILIIRFYGFNLQVQTTYFGLILLVEIFLPPKFLEIIIVIPLMYFISLHKPFVLFIINLFLQDVRVFLFFFFF